MNPTIQCDWKNCTREFEDKQEYRRHCIEHIDQRLAPTPTQIILPVETWAEVLPSCGLESLAERVSLTRRLFHAIARPLLDGSKKRVLPEMAFLRLDGENKSVLVKNAGDAQKPRMVVELPVAEVAPPPRVTGFTLILLKCFDATVLSFLCAIRSLLTNNVWLELNTNQYSSKCSFRYGFMKDNHHYYNSYCGRNEHNVAALECLLRVFPRLEWSITSLCIQYGNVLSAELLARLLANVRYLRIHSLPIEPESVSLAGPYFRNCSPHIPVLLNWLHSPTEDGHQKMAGLHFGFLENLAQFVTQAQQHFLSAKSTPIPYFVAANSSLYAAHNVHTVDRGNVELPFRILRHEHSGEVLSLRYYNEPLEFDGYKYHFVLCRRRSSCCVPSPSTPTTTAAEETDAAELLEMRAAFGRALFSKEQRNKLVLSVGQMSPIDESLFPLDSADEQFGEADGSEPGPSSAKRAKLN